MEVKVKWNKIETPPNAVDKIAMAYDAIHNGRDTIGRLYKGIFSQPYNDNYEEKFATGAPYFCFCDEITDGQPYSFSWRWYGNKAEELVAELEFLGIDIKEKEIVTE